MNYFLYILRSEAKETYYTGISNDPERRLHFHNHSDQEGYTKAHRPWKLVYRRHFASKSGALAVEDVVKGWKSKKMIRLLVVGQIDIEDLQEQPVPAVVGR